MLERFEDRTLLTVMFMLADGSPIDVADQPRSLVSADFDGDGLADLAIASAVGEVTVLLNDGEGGFIDATGSPITLAGDAWGIATADFNGDGFADLAVTDTTNNSVVILLGSDGGTFTEATGSPVSVGDFPAGIVAGDFTGNGDIDLAVANIFSDDVTILLGDGEGGFAAANPPITVGTEPSQLTAADFDGDGVLDLAVANFASNDVTILLNNGEGEFTATGSPITVGTEPAGIVSADFNGDGFADLAVTNRADDSVTILQGNGTGGFVATGSPITVGTEPRGIFAADLDGDGVIDLAVGNEGSNDVTILLGDGDGDFAQAFNSPVAAGGSPFALLAADFDGDDRADLAVINGTQSTLSILTNVPLMITIDDVTDYEGDNGPTNFVFTVSLNFDPGVPVTVNYATANGSAIAGVDYEAVAGTLTFDGTTEQTITVPVFGNEDEQPDRTFFVTLSDPEVSGGSTVILERSQGVGTIWDDDSTIQFTTDAVTTTEGTFAVVTIFRTGIGALNRPAMTTLTTGGGVDDTAIPGEDFLEMNQILNFEPQETVKSFSIPVYADDRIEPAETFSVILSNLSGVAAGEPTTLIVTIAASTVTVLPVDPNPRWVPVPYIDVEFSEPIDPETFTIDTLTLNRNGEPAELPEGVTIEALDETNQVFRVSGLESVTEMKGNYSFIVDFSQISDPFGNFGEGTGTGEFQVRPDRVAADFDGDGITDVGVYTYIAELGIGRFEVLLSSTGQYLTVDLGGEGDFPVIGDYDGDGKSDFAVYGYDEEAGFSRFLIRHSSTEEEIVLPFGGQGDFPVAGDYDGDGYTDLAVYGYSPNDGFSRFAILHSDGAPIMPTEGGTTPSGAFALPFGGLADYPIAADYDGDGITDLAVYGYSPNDGFSRFGILHSNGVPILPTETGSAPSGAFPLAFGGEGDAPVVADFDGDGITDLVVYGFSPNDEIARYAILESDGSPIIAGPGGVAPPGAFLVPFGAEGDIPIGGDYDGNGQTDLAVFGLGQFLIRSGFEGEDETVTFGRPGDIPLPPYSGLYSANGDDNGDPNGNDNGDLESLALSRRVLAMAASGQDDATSQPESTPIRRRGGSLWEDVVDRVLEDLARDA